MNKYRKISSTVLKRKRKTLVDRLSSCESLIKGSFFTRYSTCSRPTCACHQGKKHGPRSYVVVTHENKQIQHYVQRKLSEAVKKGVSQHQKLLEIVNEITLINVELMRRGEYNGRT